MKFWTLMLLQMLLGEQGVQHVDVSKALRTSVPVAAQLNGTPTPHPPAGAAPRKAPLAVEARYGKEKDTGSTISTSIEFTNLSTETWKLPISPDGGAVYKACVDKPILHSYVTWIHTEKIGQTAASITELYGCDGLDSSTVSLLPGRKLLLTGVRFPFLASSTQVPAMTYSLDTWTFSESAKGLILDIRGILEISAKFDDVRERSLAQPGELKQRQR